MEHRESCCQSIRVVPCRHFPELQFEGLISIAFSVDGKKVI